MEYTVIEDTILYEDKDLLVCHKPAGHAGAEQTGWKSGYGACPARISGEKKRAAVSCGDSSVGSAG